MTQKIKLLIGSAACISLASYLSCGRTEDAKQASTSPSNVSANAPVSDSEFLATSGSLAMNDPDKFNWTIFARICKGSASQKEVGPNKTKTNDVLWETWADDAITYPSNPNPANPPKFPQSSISQAPKHLGFITQQKLRSKFFMKAAHNLLEVQAGGGEEVRRNKASFDFIVGNNLWYQKGLADAYGKRTTTISFPTGAVEVKAVWRKIAKDSMQYFHWNYDENGVLYGLIALHIMTKAIPNWTWATWEWVGNPGRCDAIGCHDIYGANPANVDPNASPNSGYPAGDLTPDLVNLFKEFGISDEWKNYRLKGSQLDWIDQSGRTTLLGNSITEAGFITTSSCITCHSVASFDANGAPQPSIGFEPNGQSQNGPVNPNNFWSKLPPAGKPTYMQGDFVWGLLNVQ